MTDAWSRSSGKASNLSQGILNPTVYYASTDGGWWYTNCYNNNPWYSPTSVDKKGFSYAETGRKTLFDPCPPGWCIPKWEAFYPLSINSSGYNSVSGKTDAVTYVFLGPPTETSASVHPYGEFRHFLWFDYNAVVDEEPVFPIQGYISQLAEGLRLPTENGEYVHKREIRGYMWTVNGENAGGAYYRYGYGYGTSSIKQANSTDGFYSVGEQAYGTYVVGSFSNNSIGWGYWNIINRGFYRTGFSHSRGQNIRCIQEPDLPN